MVHLLVNDVRLKTTHPRRLLDDGGRPAGPPPLRTGEPGAAIEVDRTAPSAWQDDNIPSATTSPAAGSPSASTGPAATRRQRCPAAQAAQPVHPVRCGPRPRCPARRSAAQPPTEPQQVERRISSRGALTVAGNASRSAWSMPGAPSPSSPATPCGGSTRATSCSPKSPAHQQERRQIQGSQTGNAASAHQR